MTDKSITKTIRMDREIGEWLKERNARKVVESACRMVMDGRLRYDDEGVHLQNDPDKTYQALRECAEEKGIEFEGFVDDLHTQILWGMLEYKDGEIVVKE